MKAIFAILVLSTLSAIVVNGFLFKPKFKNGCDPNPCKNKAQCVLDPRNSNSSTCTCPAGFHGKLCELKSGCGSKPCRKGECIEDKKNPSNFTCKCSPGFVGPKCDKADSCAKNPCKNEGKCSLDAKFKPSCSCNVGFAGKNCEKRNCTITQFKGREFTKQSPKCFIDEKIEPKFKALDELAHLCKVKLHIIKCFTLHPDLKTGKSIDMKDKTNPGFYIGQALKFNIHDLDDKLACNEVCLCKLPIPHPGAKCFVDGLHAINWKWSMLDCDVVSTNFHLGNTIGYNNLREHHQVGCRETKF